MNEKKLTPLRMKDLEIGRKEERAKIVAWLRGGYEMMGYVFHPREAAALADTIEDEDHLK